MGEIHEGGCVCGAVRYRVKAPPQAGLVCHCTWCQRRSGSAFAFVAYFNEADVEFQRGIAAGTLDDRDWFRIDRHIWSRSARPWVTIPEGVEIYEKGSAGATPIRR